MSLATLLNGYLDRTDGKNNVLVEEHDKESPIKGTDQADILINIHKEFSKTFIKKLYFNPEWTDRIFWNVVGIIQLRFEDMTLEQIIMYITRYLSDNKMIVPHIQQ